MLWFMSRNILSSLSFKSTRLTKKKKKKKKKIKNINKYIYLIYLKNISPKWLILGEVTLVTSLHTEVT